MDTNCSSSCSFLRLRVLKNRLRTTKYEDHLNFLSVMGIESDVLDSLSFDNIKDNFAEKKQEKYLICKIQCKHSDCN